MDGRVPKERYGADGVLIDLLFVLDPDENSLSKALTRPLLKTKVKQQARKVLCQLSD